MATSKRFVAKNGLDNNNNSITNVGTAGSSLTMSGGHAVTLTTTATTSLTAPTGGTLSTISGAEVLENKTLTAPKFVNSGYIADSNGNQLISFSGTASAANYVSIANGVTQGNNGTATISAAGGASNVNLDMIPKGSGSVSVNGDQVVTVSATQSLTNKTLTSPTLTTPNIGVATATSVNKITITAPATSATLTIADGKTLTASNTLTLTGTDSSSVAFGVGGTVAYVSNKLSVFAPTTSSELAGVISDKSGTGSLVFANSPTLTNPALGTPASGDLTNCTSLPISGLTSSTAAALGVGSIELGHASDTTIARSSAGVVTIEGVEVVTVSGTATLTNKTLTAPKFASGGYIADASGNELVLFSSIASAINEIRISNAVTGTSPIIAANGGNTDIDINLYPKGAGAIKVVPTGNTTYDAIRLLPRAGGTQSYAVTLTPDTLTGDKILTLPNATDTLVARDTSETLTSKTIVLAKGTTASAPLTFQNGSNLTSPADGSMEYSKPVLYFTGHSSMGRATIPATVYTSGAGASVGTSNTENTSATYELFPATNDTVYLPVGTYYLKSCIKITRPLNSTTAASLNINILGSATSPTAAGSFFGSAIGSSPAGGSSTPTYYSIDIDGIGTNFTAAPSSTTSQGQYLTTIQGSLIITSAGNITPCWSLSADINGDANASTTLDPGNFLFLQLLTGDSAAGGYVAWV